jgi:CubicO group peptidase (beta-lactamase class C family)
VSGQSYEQFLRAHLFEPAGMHDTGYTLPHWDRARLAHGFTMTEISFFSHRPALKSFQFKIALKPRK